MSPTEPRWRVRDDLLVLEFEPDLVIYDEANGECHVLMGGAVAVWVELEASPDGVGAEDLVERVCQLVGVAPDEISNEVAETLGSLESLGLLTEQP